MNSQVHIESAREQILNQILLAYLESTDAGLSPDREAMMRQYPEFRDDLQQFFLGQDEVARLAVPLREAAEYCSQVESFCYESDSDPPTSCDPAERRRRELVQPEIGQIGDFRILRVIGCGGMGVVYETEQISLRRRVALKILPFAAAIDPRQLQRFKNEALAAAHLQHPNIVPVYAVGCERGIHYYAMQYIDGRSLSCLIRDLRGNRNDAAVRLLARSPDHLSKPADAAADGHAVADGHGGSADANCPTASFGSATDPEIGDAGQHRRWDWVARFGIQAATALEYAHQTGIVHRDVKPSNLLLDPTGRLWVTDFGLAQVMGESNLTATGEILGTLRYSSPEQCHALRGIVDHRSDIYSLGATLYELLTLRPLFEGADRNQLVRQIANDEPIPPRAFGSDIPRSLETIILKSLRKDPADRYATARDFADDLQRFLDGKVICARRLTTPDRIRNWGRRNPGLAIATIAGLLLLSAGSTISAALIRREQARTSEAHHNAESALHRERQRAAEAEVRFQLARRSVDEMIRVSEAELDIPGMGRLRRTLLTSALAYYQEFIRQRKDDPDSQTELKETAKRVEGILAELAVLHAASQFNLLNRRSVLAELEVTESQEERIDELTGRMWRSWTESYRNLVTVSPLERRRQALDQAKVNEAAVNDILTLSQRTRLREVSLQLQGPGALLEPEIVRDLQLSTAQLEQIRIIEEETQFQTMRRRTGRSRRDDQPVETATFEQPAQNQVQLANERAMAVLTGRQRRIWGRLIGEPMNSLNLPSANPTELRSFGSGSQPIFRAGENGPEATGSGATGAGPTCSRDSAATQANCR